MLASFAPEFGLDRETALKVACGAGAGFARLGETCGAAVGGLMVIGLKYGQTKPDDGAAKEKTYEVVRQFMGRFEERHGSTVCSRLIGCDISTPEGLASARDRGVFRNVCTGFVKEAVETLEEILYE